MKQLTEMAATGMHDGLNSHLKKLDRILSPYGGRRLSSRELKSINEPKYKTGWRIETGIIFKDEQILLDILCLQGFPYEKPALRIAHPETQPLDLPHLERNGKLCVWPSRFVIDTSDFEAVIEALLGDASNLLRDAISGKLDHHFQDEFLSYWSYHCKGDQIIKSLCNPHIQQHRQIVGFRYKRDHTVYSDTREELINWLDNQSLLPTGPKKKRQGSLARIFPAAIFHCDKPWLPKKFPETGKALMELIQDEGNCSDEEIIQLVALSVANRSLASPSVLVTFSVNTNDTCYAAVVFERGLFNRRNGQSAMDGFRSTMPLKTLYTQISPIKTYGNLVDRIDPDWCLGRDKNELIQNILDDKVAIIGCGSVGAATSYMLAQSGVRKFELFDPEFLSEENVSRHLLGYEYVGYKKVTALARHLKRNFPWVSVEAHDCKWQDIPRDEYNSAHPLVDADLIVSCTAEWSSDTALVDFQSSNDAAPIVFGFLEAHALAGHVIVNTLDSNAFLSIHSCHGATVGRMLTRATSWKHNTLQQVPACAGEFQPYGSIDLSKLHTLLSDISLSLMIGDRQIEPSWSSYLGSTKKLEHLEGCWSDEWVSEFGDPGKGECLLHFTKKSSQWVIA